MFGISVAKLELAEYYNGCKTRDHKSSVCSSFVTHLTLCQF